MKQRLDNYCTYILDYKQHMHLELFALCYCKICLGNYKKSFKC